MKKTYITTTEAIQIITESDRGQVTLATLIQWIIQYNLGKKIFGRWRVDKEKLLYFLKHGVKY